ncbi:MAG: hypothetical protein C4524_02695 [Candidatus Zixiibacteriota bacterium]|nr:MAG: hypothetical protein C4524_02695 [candidate division Zixibacteria bacterium]
MDKRWIYCLALVALLLPLAASAQTGSGGAMKFSDYLRSGGDGPTLQPLGIFDPSRMTFSHSYSMSYFTSGGQGAMRGLFMETIGYRLSNPLSLTLNLGYLHQPYSSSGPDGLTQGGQFVGGAALTWRPNRNMFLQLEVANYPQNGLYGYNPYWSRFPYSVPQPASEPMESEVTTPESQER